MKEEDKLYTVTRNSAFQPLITHIAPSDFKALDVEEFTRASPNQNSVHLECYPSKRCGHANADGIQITCSASIEQNGKPLLCSNCRKAPVNALMEVRFRDSGKKSKECVYVDISHLEYSKNFAIPNLLID